MIEPEFNLLDEPWIRVRRPDCSVEEVSLKTLFAHAHEYEDLAGETPAQDLAMLRLLLAVLHCVFSRKNEKGEDRPLSLDVLKSKALREEAVRRWGALWELRRFPYELMSIWSSGGIGSGCFMRTDLFGKWQALKRRFYEVN